MRFLVNTRNRLRHVGIATWLAVIAVGARGDARFATEQMYDVGGAGWFGPRGIAITDLDGDEHVDLAVVNIPGGAVSILTNAGDGTFGLASTLDVGDQPGAVAAGDLDGDTRVDLLVTRQQENEFTVYRNEGGAVFARGATYATGNAPTSIVMVDLDGDEDLDVAVGNGFSSSGHEVSVYLNSGDGNLSPQTYYSTESAPHSLSAADLDGDGRLDLVTAERFSYTVSVLLNNGDGTFAEAAVYFPVTEASFVTVGRLDDDAHPDLAVVTRGPGFDGEISMMFNNGDGSFGPPVGRELKDGWFGALAIGDFDGDGDSDVVGAGATGPGLSLLLNDGAGDFVWDSVPAAVLSRASIYSVDLNADERLDLVTSNYFDDTVSVFLDRAIGDLDGDGRVDFTDLLLLLAIWGPCGDPCPPCPGDLDRDCTVSFDDLIMLLANWG